MSSGFSFFLWNETITRERACRSSAVRTPLVGVRKRYAHGPAHGAGYMAHLSITASLKVRGWFAAFC